jgi:tRNA pseudouridine55 synthase
MPNSLPTSHLAWQDGVMLLVDKPLGWTSFDVVNKLRYTISRKAGKIKIGHAGTLDPLATGLLIICTGKMTKQIDSFQASDKTYEGTLKFGATTISYDSEFPEQNPIPTDALTQSLIEKAIEKFKGDISQKPPIFSAVKVDGTRLYEHARKDKEVELPLRYVTVNKFELKNFDNPNAAFEINCSKGTYIRSLVHDLGQCLEVGAYMTSLRRTKSGEYSIEDALPLSELIDYIQNMES